MLFNIFLSCAARKPFIYVKSMKFFDGLVRFHGCLMPLVLAIGCLVTPSVHAAGTPAGTAIDNSATISYTVASQAASSIVAHAPTLVTVELIDLVLTGQEGSLLAVNSPDVGRALTYVLTNTGNAKEAFRLTRFDAVSSDQFDPISAPGSTLYLESGAQTGFQASGPNADIAYMPGQNDPILSADQSLTVYVLSSIPADLPDGATGKVLVSATSLTPGAAGSAPGTVLAGLGAGAVDAVVAGRGGKAQATGEYVVSGIGLSLIKSVHAVRDKNGGDLVMSKSVLTYRIVMTLVGKGIAENLSFVDPLAVSTTYMPGSLTVDGAARTDSVDSDNANFAEGVISIAFGNLAAPAARTIEFKVTVN